jgi:hypothetical protein
MASAAIIHFSFDYACVKMGLVIEELAGVSEGMDDPQKVVDTFCGASIMCHQKVLLWGYGTTTSASSVV